MLYMAALWTTEAIPLAITSTIPIVAFPLLGLMSSVEVSVPVVQVLSLSPEEINSKSILIRFKCFGREYPSKN